MIPGPNDPQILDPQSSVPWSEVYLAEQFASEWRCTICGDEWKSKRCDRRACPNGGLDQPEHSDWMCHLFGSSRGITYRPLKGEEPNWFHRWMQRLAFGFKWERH